MRRPVAFEQDPGMPPGVGTFHLDDGSSLYADDFASAQGLQPPPASPMGAVAANTPQPPQGLGSQALNWGRRAAAGASGLGGMVTQRVLPDPKLQEPLHVGAGAAGERGVQRATADVPVMPTKKPTEGGAPPAEGPAVPGGELPPDIAGIVEQGLQQGKWVGGTPGVSPEQLERKREGAVQMPSGATVTTEGAIPPNEDILQGYAEVSQYRQELADSQAMRAIARNEAQAAQIAAQLPEMEQKAARAQLHLDVLKGKADNELQGVKQLMDQQAAAMQKSVDPGRIFKNAGPIATIGAVIAQAVGAYAATLGGGKNYAKEIIDDAINRDIMAQKSEIEMAMKRGQTQVNNALWGLTQTYGSVEQASTALEMMQHSYAQRSADMYAAEAGSEDAWAALQDFKAAEAQRMLELQQKFYEQSLGKQTVQERYGYEFPVQGSPGYRRELSAKEQLELLKAGYDVAGKEAGLGKTRAQTGKIASEAYGTSGKGQKFDKRVEAYGKERAKFVAGQKALERARAELKAIAAKHDGNLPGVGVVDLKNPKSLKYLAEVFGNEYAKDALRVQQIKQAATNAAVESNKGAASEGDVARYAGQVEGAGTEQELWDGFDGMANKTKDSADALGGAFGSDVVQTWEQQQQDVQLREQSKGKLKPR